MTSSPPPSADAPSPVGVLTYLPNSSGAAACEAGIGGVRCRRPAHWMLVAWDDVEDQAGDMIIARLVLCREHLTSAVADVERRPGGHPAEGFVNLVDLAAR